MAGDFWTLSLEPSKVFKTEIVHSVRIKNETRYRFLGCVFFHQPNAVQCRSRCCLVTSLSTEDSRVL